MPKLYEYLGIISNKLDDDAVVDVVEAEYIPPYTIHLWFSDGAEQRIDFEPFLRRSHHPEIRKYLNTKRFARFSIANGRLDWNDYDLCFPMKDLYEGTIIKPPVGEHPSKDPARLAG